MLTELRIKDIGLVDDQIITFGPAFNVITGETGAGKSMTVGAITLIAGERSSTDILRNGVEKGTVEALFDLTLRPDLRKALEEYGIVCSEHQLVVKREIAASGKARCFLNGSAASLAQVKQVGDLLIDMHGPHEHQSLLKAASHISIIDSFGGLEPETDKYREIYQKHKGFLEEKRRFLEEDKLDGSMAEFIRYQIKEIKDASLSLSEEEDLKKEEALLANFENISSAGQSAYRTLYESDGSVIKQVSEIKRSLEKIAEVEKSFDEIKQKTGDILVDMRDIAERIRDFTSKLDSDPVRLEKIQERLSLISKIKKKYGPAVEDVLRKKEELEKKMAGAEKRDEIIAELDKKIAETQAALGAGAKKLSKKRQAAARELSKKTKEVLQKLGMQGAAFSVRMDEAPYNENGMDEAQFFISTNPGIAEKPLVDIASSGEVSRVMLAIKKVIAQTDKVPVMIFDEIDVNIGGKTADIVASEMKEIAKSHQLVVISHLPHIAAKAQRHFVVEKNVKSGKTNVIIKPVSGPERVEEIARMLGGKESTSVIMEHAKELLDRN